MGAFYNSICLPGDERQGVRESLERWLSLRGFERVHDSVLFDLDGETERSAFLLWNENWTVLVFSKYEEERRLIRDLQGWKNPVLYVWVQDSDVWGYDLFDRRGFSGSFVSDAGAYQSFPDHEIGSEGRPWARPAEVCERLGKPGQEKILRKIEKKSAAFEEEVCAEFCRLFGVDGAMASYDDLERGAVGALAGWECEHLFLSTATRCRKRRVGNFTNWRLVLWNLDLHFSLIRRRRLSHRKCGQRWRSYGGGPDGVCGCYVPCSG
jgi:hypothetical protein